MHVERGIFHHFKRTICIGDFPGYIMRLASGCPATLCNTYTSVDSEQRVIIHRNVTTVKYRQLKCKLSFQERISMTFICRYSRLISINVYCAVK